MTELIILVRETIKLKRNNLQYPCNGLRLTVDKIFFFRNTSQMSTKSANSSTTNSTDDLSMDSNYNIDTDSTGAERILKLLP